jgi:hypothetical protein
MDYYGAVAISLCSRWLSYPELRFQVDTLFKVNQLMDDFDYFAAAGMA